MNDRGGICGILLAAGASRRMGTLKPLLPFEGKTALERCLETFRGAGASPIYLVLGFAAERIRSELAEPLSAPDIRVVVNERHERGMLTSIQAGVRAVLSERAEAVVLGLVDQPFLSVETFRRVTDAYRTSGARIVVPEWGGKRGHPIVLSMSLAEAILALEGEAVGLRDLIRARESDRLLVPMEEDSVLRDMDEPEDYRRELAAWRERSRFDSH